MFSNLLRGLGAMLENDALVSMIGAVICFVLVWFIGPPKKQPETLIEHKRRAWGHSRKGAA